MSRNGQVTVIEKRMLSSIDRYVRLSGLSNEEISTTPDLPNLPSMYQDLKIPNGEYVSMYTFGSQYIHGTWSDLLSNYLRATEDGSFELRDHDVIPDQNEFSATCLILLRALSAFVTFLFDEEALQKIYLNYFNEIRDHILEIYDWGIGNDNDIVTSET